MLQWRFIDGVAARIDDAALREAQSRKDAVRAYELVYAAPRCVSALVGLDVGTSGVKALAVSRDGEVLARAERAVRALDAAPGLGRAGPRGLVAGGPGCARRPRPSSPPAIGLSGQMHGLVLLDERERVLRPAILWNDQRTGAECAEIEATIGLERLIALTGNRALTGFTAPKLLWVRRHEPEVWARVAHVLLPKDYVRLRLTGERSIDAADASGTLLFDVANRRWSEEVLDALELPGEWLPPVHESTEVGTRGRPGRGRARRRRRGARAALGRPRDVGRRLRRARASTARSPRRGSTRSATPCPARGTRWA